MPGIFGQSLLFKEYPYLLPCMVSSVVSVIGSVIGFVFLEETAPAVVKRHKVRNMDVAGSASTIVGDEYVGLPESLDGVPPSILERGESTASIQLSFREIMNGNVCMSILCYATWCLVTIIYEEVYALYVAEPLRNGGLQFDSFDIGVVMSLSGIAQVISQLVCYPYFERKYGLLGTFRIAGWIMAVFSFALPFCTDYARSIVTNPDGVYSSEEKVKVFLLLFFLLAGKTLGCVIGYVPVIILVNNAAPTASSLGTVHGCGQVAASLVRSFGPTIGGIMWSWSLSQSFPFDFHFTLFFCGALSLLAVWESYVMKRYI
ncbi:hypothetical protein HDU91_001405 [Kappamyces sp. JEL0680]|nr:hypothetical protein HDU91_001405 [Kappamyces sp. JEL0680]